MRLIAESNPDVDKLEVGRLLSEMMEADRTTTFLSSWYLGDDEKIEMWNEYAKDGVIIVSHTWKLLSLLPKPLDQAVNFCSCVYNNKKKEKSLGNSFAYKNEKFTHENEYRLVFDLGKYSLLTGYAKEKIGEVLVGEIPSYKHPDYISCMNSSDYKNAGKVLKEKADGYILKYNLKSLISEIRIHPNLSEDLENNIKKLCEKENIPIAISTLSAKLLLR